MKLTESLFELALYNAKTRGDIEHFRELVRWKKQNRSRLAQNHNGPAQNVNGKARKLNGSTRKRHRAEQSGAGDKLEKVNK